MGLTGELSAPSEDFVSLAFTDGHCGKMRIKSLSKFFDRGGGGGLECCTREGIKRDEVDFAWDILEQLSKTKDVSLKVIETVQEDILECNPTMGLGIIFPNCLKEGV